MSTYSGLREKIAEKEISILIDLGLTPVLRIYGEMLVPCLIKIYNRGKPEKKEKILEILENTKDFILGKGVMGRLDDSDKEFRTIFAERLGRRARTDNNTFKLLLEGLNNSSYRIREGCAIALGRAKNVNAADVLLIGLKDDYDIRRACAVALGELGKTDKEVLKKIIKGLLISKDWKVREGCAIALGIIKDPWTIDALALRATDERLNIRKECAGALGAIGNPKAIDALAKLLENEKLDLKIFFLELLKSATTYDYALRILNGLKYTKLKKDDDFFSTYSEITGECSQKLLLWGLSNEDHKCRLICVKILEELGKDDLYIWKVLFEGMKLENVNVAESCAMAYNGILWQAETVKLWIGFGDDNHDKQKLCLDILVKRNDPKVLYFKKIIYDLDKKYAKEIGLENTLKIIKEYLDLIKDKCPEDKLKNIKLRLFAFYR